MHRQDVHDARAQERLLQAEKAVLDRRLEKLAPLDGLGDRLDRLEEEHHAISKQVGAGQLVASSPGRAADRNAGCSTIVPPRWWH